MLKIKNLYTEMNGFSLRDINIEVEKGETLVVLGSSGSGKTLLLESIAGKYSPRGRIVLNNKEMAETPPEKRNIGFVYQQYELFEFLTVEENIRFPLKVRKIGREKQREKLDHALEYFGILHLRERKIKNLSGGEKQRTALARVWVMEPDLYLLDEPVSALDKGIRLSALKGIKRISENNKTPIIYVTHSAEEALYLGDKIIILHKGMLQKRISKKEIQTLKEDQLEYILYNIWEKKGDLETNNH